MDEPWTQVPNDFIDVLMKNLNGGVCKVYLAICRKTIGWHKTSDKIAYSQLKELTGLENTSINEALKILESMDRIVIERVKGKPNKIDLNFRPLRKPENTSPESREVTSPLTGETKEIRKDTNKIYNISASASSQAEPAQNDVIKSLIHYYSEAYFKKTGERGTIGWGQWGAALKRWLRLHKPETIKKVMDYFFAYPKRMQCGFNKFQTAFDNLLPMALGHIKPASASSGWTCPKCGKLNNHTGGFCLGCRWEIGGEE